MTVAFVFPGQGSQSAGMLGAIAETRPAIRETFKQASDALGYDLWSVCQDDPDGHLARTEITQPALLTASVALWREWVNAGGTAPVVMAGHSLGEYSALVCSGALEFEDAVRLVEQRGRLMQEAVPHGTGAMAAILGLDDDVVQAACAAVETGVVAPANFNAPGQVVIAGEKAAVDEAIEHCKAGGARRALPLPVSVPSHCLLMQPAADRLAEALAEITMQGPAIPVVNNVDVKTPDDPADICDALIRQLFSPVRWVEVMRSMGAHKTTTIIECGAGNVLAGLQKRINRQVTVFAIEKPEVFDEALTATAGEEGGA
ncbi:MAG: ACP S-malonyltransferase [Pseudomonadota bacterium]